MKGYTMSKLLLDEYPLIILPELAAAIGLNEAIVLQQVHYWLEYYRKVEDLDHFQDERWWVYNSVAQWCDQFPFWGYNTIKRTLAALRKPYTPRNEQGNRAERGPLLLTSNYNRVGFDKTIWYTIDYEEFEGLSQRLAQNGPTISPKWANRSVQNGPMEEPKMGQPIPETSADYQTEANTERAAAGRPAAFCSIHRVEMKRWEKDGQTWYSHRHNGGWCKGAPGDVTPEPETGADRRNRYVTEGVLT